MSYGTLSKWDKYLNKYKNRTPYLYKIRQVRALPDKEKKKYDGWLNLKEQYYVWGLSDQLPDRYKYMNVYC